MSSHRRYSPRVVARRRRRTRARRVAASRFSFLVSLFRSSLRGFKSFLKGSRRVARLALHAETTRSTLVSRVVDTAAIGPIGHTSRTVLCDASGGGRCAEEGAADPSGAWTRAMVDFYLGGLTSAFVSALFSSWQAAMLSRSLLCCKRRMHFGAMYSQANSHRDKPMPNVTFLQAVTQTAVRGEVEGGGA